MISLTAKSFAAIFNDKETNFPLVLKQLIKSKNFNYSIVEGKEYEQAISQILKTLESKDLKPSGSHRLKDWEIGWRKHLEDFNNSNYDIDVLIAKFAAKKGYKRLYGKLIKAESNTFEDDFLAVIRYYLFNKYYKNINTLYEFGCGTGINLVAAASIFPKLKLVGLDWANSSVEIINTLRTKLKVNASGRVFDLFNPDKTFRLDRISGILTIGTLEQLGGNFKPFVKYLLENKPNICVHLETIYELYDRNNKLDTLAIKYLEQRNYLKGFLLYLKDLEKEKRIKILEVRRTFGSLYHEGFTYTVWKPI